MASAGTSASYAVNGAVSMVVHSIGASFADPACMAKLDGSVRRAHHAHMGMLEIRAAFVTPALTGNSMQHVLSAAVASTGSSDTHAKSVAESANMDGGLKTAGSVVDAHMAS